MLIDNVDIRASGFNPGRDELAEYVKYVKARAGDVDFIVVTKCEDGFIDVRWTKHNLPFERIRRVTGSTNQR